MRSGRSGTLEGAWRSLQDRRFERRVYDVGELTALVRSVIEGKPELRHILVRGEISNFKRHTSGHLYFTLKDKRSRLRCVFFRGKAARLTFEPDDGMVVVAEGAIGVYEVNGDYQLYVDRLEPAGKGELYLAFEQLKARLAGEGLFGEERKRPLPFLPRRVGVITSSTGAALRDIVSVARRRNPRISLVLIPAIVQGEAGPPSLCRALELAAAWGGIDVLIIGRGGGSLEELWAFNDEAVARAIAGSPMPVVSAVGHETDFTIADFVADRRAPTPSAAAEIVIPDLRALVEELEGLRRRIEGSVARLVKTHRRTLELLQSSAVLTRPLDRIRQFRQHVDELQERAVLHLRRSSSERRRKLEVLAGKLDSLSPLQTLARGFSICSRADDDAVVRRLDQVAPGTAIHVRVTDGVFDARVVAADDEYGGRHQARLPFA